jgi:hypothetical protein
MIRIRPTFKQSLKRQSIFEYLSASALDTNPPRQLLVRS